LYQFALEGGAVQPARRLALVANRPVDALQKGFQSVLKYFVVVRTAQPAFRLELHVLYAARRAGQSRQLVGELADVLTQDRLQQSGEVDFILLEPLLLLGALLAEVQLALVTVDDVGQVYARRLVARMALHAAFPWFGIRSSEFGIAESS